MTTHFILERYRYAPEMTALHVVRDGRFAATLPAPGAETPAEARKRLFPRAVPAIVATVTTHYAEDRFKGLERTYRGVVPDRAAALAFARELRRRNPGGPLLDGSTIPPLEVRVRTELRGVRA